MSETIEKPRVWNKHDRNCPGGAVYVGRGSRWGNPFRISFAQTREQVIERFRGGMQFIDRDRPAILFECGADANAGLDRRALFDQITDAMRYDVFTFGDFLYNKGRLDFDEFRKCGLYPFRAFNFVAMPRLAGLP